MGGHPSTTRGINHDHNRNVLPLVALLSAAKIDAELGVRRQLEAQQGLLLALIQVLGIKQGWSHRERQLSGGNLLCAGACGHHV